MPGITIPDGGVALGTALKTVGPKTSNIHSQQAMRITFTDNSILEDVLKHGAGLKISFGKSMRFIYGSQTMEILSTVEPNRHELYRASADLSGGELAFAATFTHQLEVRELEDTKDEGLLALQDTFRRIHQEKEASTTAVVDSSFPAKGGKRTAYLKKTPQVGRAKTQRSLPTTPLLRGARSPAENPANVTAKLDALRVPLIHLLAMGPDSEQNLASKTRVSNEICVRILQKVGNRVGKQWQLVDDVYKDLDLWDFQYPSQADRDQAITNCRAAFNRLRLSREATEWQMILAPDDRGKVDPNPPLPQPVKLPPKPAPTPSIMVTAESIESSKTPAQTTAKKGSGGEVVARLASQTTKGGKPPPKDAISRIIGKKGKKGTTTKATTKPKGQIGRPPKSATAKTSKANPTKEFAAKPKVKSAERVEDSDEDIEMEDVKLVPPKLLEKKATTPPLRQTTLITRAPSTSGSIHSDLDIDNSRLKPKKASTPNIAKSPIKKQRREVPRSNNSTSTITKKKSGYVKVPASNVSKALPSRDYIARRSSSNSPPKPSPLGSSPPLNASDIDNTSAASSPSFLTPIAGTSTPGRSPLDSITVASSRVSKQRYHPVASPPLKRKAATPAERDDRVPCSRIGSTRTPTSSAPTSLGSASNKRRNTNSPDAYIIQLARKFKEDHARYERLYREVQAITDSLKKKEKLDTVLSMHRDLETLKARISASASVH